MSHGVGDPVVLQPVGELVLAIGRLQRRQRSGRPVGARAPVRRGRRSPRAARPGSWLRTSSAELLAHLGEHLAQPTGRPHHRRHRVVQLVGEPGGHRAERDQPLVPVDGVAGRRSPGPGPPSRRWAAIGNHSLHRLPQVGGGQLEQPAVGDRPRRARVQLRTRRARSGRRRTRRCRSRGSRCGTARARHPAPGSTSPASPTAARRSTTPGRPRRGSWRRPDTRRRDRARRATSSWSSLELLEQEQRAQLVRRQPFGLAHRCSR